MPNWKPDHFRLFLTHVSTQKSVAHNLKESLEPYYVSCFVAHDDIEPTREWQDEIEEALRAMDALAALLSPDFHTSNWTDQEVGFAVGSGRLVIPLRFGLDPYGFIAKYQGYQITQVPYSTIAQELLKVLARHGRTSLAFGRAIVKRLENSWSWDSAKSSMSLIEECAVLDEDLLQRIETAVQNNGEVAAAWGVPDRIQTLVRRHRHVGSD
jgi:TIR domain